MKQGTTFVLVVDLQLDMSYVKSIIFTLKNKGKILTKEDWSFEDGKFKIPFAQEETVQLEGRTLIEAQINFEDGNVAKSEIKEIFIKESLATHIVDENKATEETQEIGLVIDGDVVYTDGIGGGDYKLPIATESTLGGVKPLNKTKEMTQEVGVDKDGRLFAKGKDITVDSELSEESTNPVQNKVIAKEVIALRERNAELEETIEKLQIKTTTSPSLFHHITDSANMKVVDFGMKGKTEQNTVPGNQLFDLANSKGFVSLYSGLSTEIDVANNTLTTTNSHTSDRTGYLDLGVLQADTYYLSFENVNGYITNPVINYGELETGLTRIAAIQNTGGSFTIEEELHCWVVCTLKNDNPLKLKNIMLNKGDTALPVEEYVGGMPSPNPEHEEEITLAGVYNEETGRYEHKCCVGNKNFWDKEFASDNSNWVNLGWYDCLPIRVQKGATINISYQQDLLMGTGLHVAVTTSGAHTGTKWLYHNSVQNLIVKNQSIKAETDYIYIQCAGVIDMGGQLDLFMQYIGNDLQIEISDTATELESHASQPFTLTSDRPLTKWDYKAKRDGLHGWSINHYKRIFDGTENWKEFDTDKIVLYDFEVLPIKHEHSETIGSKSEHFREVDKLANITINTFATCSSGASKWTVFKVGMSVDEWKTYLAEQYANGTPVYIIYPTDEEQAFIPLPDEEQELLHDLETYYGVTNVYNEQGCPMWLTYVADQELHWNQKLLQIQQAII